MRYFCDGSYRHDKLVRVGVAGYVVDGESPVITKVLLDAESNTRCEIEAAAMALLEAVRRNDPAPELVCDCQAVERLILERKDKDLTVLLDVLPPVTVTRVKGHAPKRDRHTPQQQGFARVDKEVRRVLRAWVYSQGQK